MTALMASKSQRVDVGRERDSRFWKTKHRNIADIQLNQITFKMKKINKFTTILT